MHIRITHMFSESTGITWTSHENHHRIPPIPLCSTASCRLLQWPWPLFETLDWLQTPAEAVMDSSWDFHLILWWIHGFFMGCMWSNGHLLVISCAFIGILMRLNGHVIVILKFNGSTIGKTNSYNDFDWDLTDHGNRKLISGTFFFMVMEWDGNIQKASCPNDSKLPSGND